MSLKLLITAEYALFTRPEAKVERVSYDVPTPSALDGVLKSVYWKPAIRYNINKIIVYNPIRFINVRKNEVKNKVLLSKVKAQMSGKDSSPEIYAAEERSQRANMMLYDVKYGVEFTFSMTGIRSDKEDECDEKHYNIIKRRLEKGQWFKTPYLGCRECSVKSIELVDEFDYTVPEELKGDVDLGYMLYGMRFKDGGVPVNGDWDKPCFSDDADAMFYHPHMIDGVIDVDLYRRTLKCL